MSDPGDTDHGRLEPIVESRRTADIPTTVSNRGLAPSSMIPIPTQLQSQRPPSQLTNVSENTIARGRRLAREGQPNIRWVDENYYTLNPWFDRGDKDPVFSLGRPLPRKVRWVKKPATKDTNKSKLEMAELGEVRSKEQSINTGDGNQDSQGQRRTAGGVSHGDKINDAGQPVFDYQPSNEDRKENLRQPNNSRSHEDGPDFGIDSEPLGKQEHQDSEEEDVDPNEYRNWWARFRAKNPEPLAEFLAV